MHRTTSFWPPLSLLAGLLSASAVLVAGCSADREESPAANAAGAAPGAAAIPGIDPASRLDLDGGRVSVFSPAGWRRAPRSYDYLVRYQATPQVSYPSVVVLAADPPADITEVTADSQAAFVEAMASLLAESVQRPPIAPEKPLRQRLLESAIGRGGAISVTQGVADTGATFEEVEAELIDLVGTGYVDIDNAPGTGVVIYRFTELS